MSIRATTNAASIERNGAEGNAAQQDAVGAKPCGGVTFRVVAISLLLAGLFGYIVPILDVQVNNTKLGAGHLPVGALAVLLILLLGVNPLLKMVARRFALQRTEILTIYISCLFSTLVPGMGSESFFVAHFIGSFYFATRENGSLQFLEPYLQPWFTPGLDASGRYGSTAKSAIEGWYIGTGGAIPWGAWLVPLVAWGAFVFASYVMLGCLSVMLRAQWNEREALSFPLLKLPLEMTQDVDAAGRPDIRRFFSNRLMWVGFGAMVLVNGLNGLNFYFPDVPRLGLGLGSTQALFTEAPWNQMAPTQMQVWPIFAAIAFLLSAEVSLSLWFFLWFVQAQYVVAYTIGFPYGTLPAAIGHSSDGGGRAFTAFQQVGAYIAYASILLWAARQHLRHIASRAFGRSAARAAEAGEPLSYPLAFWGFVLAFGFMIAWSCAAGLRVDVALALWALYLVTTIVLSRAVVEGGVMFINQGWVPLGTLAQLFGSGPGRWLAPSSIVPASFMQVSFFQDMRGFIMPSFLHGFKLAQERHIAQRPLFALILATTFVAMVVGLWVKVRMGYIVGGLALHPWFATVAPQYPAQNAHRLINGEGAGAGHWFWMVVGGGFTVLMTVARGRLAWFPLHPLGYMLALTAPTQRAWFSFFIGWLAKVVVTRFGGHDSYKSLVPVALGIILGEVSMFLFWLVVDALLGRSGHSFLP